MFFFSLVISPLFLRFVCSIENGPVNVRQYVCVFEFLHLLSKMQIVDDNFYDIWSDLNLIDNFMIQHQRISSWTILALVSLMCARCGHFTLYAPAESVKFMLNAQHTHIVRKFMNASTLRC